MVRVALVTEKYIALAVRACVCCCGDGLGVTCLCA